MKKFFSCKKIFLMTLSSLLLTGIFSTCNQQTAHAAESGSSSNEIFAEWSFDKATGCLTISGTGRMYDKKIYEEESDNTWKWDYWEPEYYKEVKSVIIEPGITHIDEAVFNNFKALKSITIPDTVIQIEAYAFYNCTALEEITIPDSVTSIGAECFWGCSSLKRINFGKNLETIGDRAFYQCGKLRSISVNSKNSHIAMKAGILYQKKEKILYFCLPTKKNQFTIQKGTKKISSLAFAGQKALKKINIPASVKTIEGGAFYRCSNLTKVNFPKNSKCTSIEHYYIYLDGYEETFGAFQDCKKIRTITLPDSVQYIGNRVFNGCTSLEQIHFGKNLRGFLNVNKIQYAEKGDIDTFLRLKGVPIKSYSVSNKNKLFSSQNGILYNKKKTLLCIYPRNKADTVVDLPKGLKGIHHGAFYQNQYVQKVILPQSLKTIGVGAFEGCRSLKEVEFPKRLKTICSEAFKACKKLKAAIIMGKGTVIEAYAFTECKALESVTLKQGIKKIGHEAFYDCQKLKQISIPKSVTIIGKDALGRYLRIKKLSSNTTSYVTKTVKGFRIYGQKGSVAQKYAQKNHIKFIKNN